MKLILNFPLLVFLLVADAQLLIFISLIWRNALVFRIKRKSPQLVCLEIIIDNFESQVYDCTSSRNILRNTLEINVDFFLSPVLNTSRAVFSYFAHNQKKLSFSSASCLCVSNNITNTFSILKQLRKMLLIIKIVC